MKKFSFLFILVAIFTLVSCGSNTQVSSSTHTHTWDDGIVIKPANCTNKGKKRYSCRECNETKEEEIPIDSANHSYDEGVVIKIPTFNETGTRRYTCVRCNKTLDVDIEKEVVLNHYDLDAKLVTGMPGVYETKAVVGDSNTGENPKTIGIPTVSKKNLVNFPTTESPAIIRGAATGFEKRIETPESSTDAKFFEPIEGKTITSPYSKFRWSIIKETLTDAYGVSQTHNKLSGFDGTYYIIRVDVSDVVKDKTSGYLHVKQESNSALMVMMGMQYGVDTGKPATDANNKATATPTIGANGNWFYGDEDLNIKVAPYVSQEYPDIYTYQGTNGNWYVNSYGFATGMGALTVSYTLENNARLLKDTDDGKPYVDVIVMSSGKLVAGADTGQANAPSADIKLSFYIDDTFDYDPTFKYDPTYQDPQGATPTHAEKVLAKFYKEDGLTEANRLTSYLVKGSDLEIDVEVDEQQDDNSKLEYWSLTKAFNYQQFDSHEIKIICEVPVLEGIVLEGTADNVRNIILNLNSLDIQFANHSETSAAALQIKNYATLEILDRTRTSGAELAIGNNASMIVSNGGTLIIAESCQLEIEYDAATITVDPNNPQPTDQSQATPLANGVMTIKEGGKVINKGVINIEGTEVKPNQQQQQGQTTQTQTDMKTSVINVARGAILDNYGCISLKGELIIEGTLNNYGKYSDTIVFGDPDKGQITYHKGIQIYWKDNVTNDTPVTDDPKTYSVNENINPGKLTIGVENNTGDTSILNNYGDIVLVPGKLIVYGGFKNLANTDNTYTGHLYVCDVTEAIVPILPTTEAPTVTEEVRKLNEPYLSVVDKTKAREFVDAGMMKKATVKLVSNGILGELTEVTQAE